MSQHANEIEILKRKLARTQKAQRAAEQLLEDKTREIFLINEQLKSSESRTRAILDTVNSGIMTVDEHGLVQAINPAVTVIFDQPQDAIVGQSFNALMPSPFREAYDGALQRQPSKESTAIGHTREIQGLRPDGTVFPLELTVTPFAHDGQGQFICVFRDLTERKNLEAQLVQAQKLESVGQLAAGIAHEINTPIQFVGDNIRFMSDSINDLLEIIATYRGLAQQSVASDSATAAIEQAKTVEQEKDLPFLEEEIPSAIEQSLEGVNRVATIVAAMKEFSHPGTLQMQPINLNNAISNTITVARNEWKYVAEMVTEFEEDLPLVSCHAGELNQVVLNIVVNAAHAIADHSANGGPETGTITISTRRDGPSVEMRISDTGTGISEEARHKIFDPFFTTKGVGKGTGQGLALAHSIVTKKHDGTIGFETEIGKGTTFIIRLPIEAATKA